MFSAADLASFSVSVGSVSVDSVTVSVSASASVSVGSFTGSASVFVSDSVVSSFTGSAFSAVDSASTLAGSLASSFCSFNGRACYTSDSLSKIFTRLS